MRFIHLLQTLCFTKLIILVAEHVTAVQGITINFKNHTEIQVN